jgi:RimJ/RimL family protein N-acetyltransferase
MPSPVRSHEAAQRSQTSAVSAAAWWAKSELRSIMSRAASHICAQSSSSLAWSRWAGSPRAWSPHDSPSMHAWWQSVAAAIATANRSPARVVVRCSVIPRSFRSTLLRRARTPILPGRAPEGVLSVLPIETERLRIRELEESDADGAHRVYGDPEVMRYVGADGKARTREQSAAGVARMIDGQRRNGFSLWAVEVRETGEMIGVCGVVHVDGTGLDVELVYEFQRSAWGRGYATEAARACLAAALGPLGLKRVVALAYPENAQSIRIMQKLGMRDTGMIEAYGQQLVCYEALAGDE